MNDSVSQFLNSEVHGNVTGHTCSNNGRACNVQQDVDSANDSALGEVQVDGHVLVCIREGNLKSRGSYGMSSARWMIVRM